MDNGPSCLLAAEYQLTYLAFRTLLRAASRPLQQPWWKPFGHVDLHNAQLELS